MLIRREFSADNVAVLVCLDINQRMLVVLRPFCEHQRNPFARLPPGTRDRDGRSRRVVVFVCLDRREPVQLRALQSRSARQH